MKDLLTTDGQIVALIKPQFEAGRQQVGKKGVVRDKKVHLEVICNIMEYAQNTGFQILELSFSPIKGPEGNIEYLLYLKKDQTEEGLTEDRNSLEENNQKLTEEGGTFLEESYRKLAKEVVEKAHGTLEGDGK